MARKSSIWYWARAGGFYTTIRGSREFLAKGPNDEQTKGPVYQAACKAFNNLIGLAHADGLGDSNTLRTVCERYLEWVQKHRARGTYDLRRKTLRNVVRYLGDVRMVDLQPRFLDRYFTARVENPQEGEVYRKEYAQNTRRSILHSLRAALRWASGPGGLISKNPLAGMEMPAAESRGMEVLITPTQHLLALAATEGWERDFLICLEGTGCRPGELLAATATHWRPEINAIVYPGARRARAGEHRHKTSRTNKDRVIYFTGESLAVVRRLVQDRPTGKLFRARSRQGLARSTVNLLFSRLQDKLGLPHFIATSYRHTFATRALRLGWTVDMVAALLGNSPEVLREHYGHLADDCRAMALAMTKIRAEMEASA